MTISSQLINNSKETVPAFKSRGLHPCFSVICDLDVVTFGVEQFARVDGNVTTKSLSFVVEPDDEFVIAQARDARRLQHRTVNIRIKNRLPELPARPVLAAFERMKISGQAFFDTALDFGEIGVRLDDDVGFDQNFSIRRRDDVNL